MQRGRGGGLPLPLVLEEADTYFFDHIHLWVLGAEHVLEHDLTHKELLARTASLLAARDSHTLDRCLI